MGSKTETHKSVGTISAEVRSHGKAVVWFTADRDHSVKHAGKKCAAFVTDEGTGCLVKYEADKDAVRLGTAKELLACSAVHAARSGTAVQVGICMPKTSGGGKSELTLCSIRIPAPKSD